MGDFRIEIKGTGGHGCDRDAQEGEELAPRCANPSCPDCMARKFVDELKATGMLAESYGSTATFTHWPGKPEAVVDDLLGGVRASGSFK